MNRELNMIMISDKTELATDFVSQFKMRGGKLIPSIQELNSKVLKDYSNVCILEGFFDEPENETMLNIFQELYDFSLYYIGSDVESNIYLQSIAKCYKCSVDNLKIGLVENILADDSIAVEHMILNDGIIEETEEDCAQRFLNTYKNKSDEYRLAEGYLNLIKSIDSLAELKEYYKREYEKMKNEIQGKERIVLNCIKEYKNLISNINKTNLALREYENVLTKDIYETVDVTGYKNRPFIIYMKQYQELIHQDTLIKTLYGALTYQLRSSAKVLKLYDSIDTIGINNLADDYKLLGKTYRQSDFETNDFIAKVGDYGSLLDKLLINLGNLDYLIIVDCKLVSSPILVGHDLKYALCRNSKNIEKHRILDNYTITCNGKDNLRWGHYDELSNLADDNEKFSFLSSRPAITSILDAINIKGVNDSGY